jgi:hypothetical protein
MRVHGGFSPRPATLRASIRDVESRIRRRQGDIGIALGNVAHNIGERMLSPAMIIAAGLFGAAIQRDQRLRGLRILSILHTANAGLRLLLTVTSGTRAPPRDSGASPYRNS